MRTTILLLLAASLAIATMPPELEVPYSEASLAFNSGEVKKALELIGTLVAKFPDNRELLELRALIIEKTQPAQSAIAAYKQLSEMAFSKVWDRSISGLYEFKLGVLYFQEKQMKEARSHLEKAIQYRANVGPSHFYIGLLEMHQGNPEKARRAFEIVLASDAKDLKPLVHLYLAEIFHQNNDGTNSVRSYLAARELASTQLNGSVANKSLANTVLSKVDKETRAFDQSLFVANIGVLGGYNSNVLSIPGSGLISSGSENSASVQSLLQYSLGYVSAPLRPVQFLPSYSGSLNLNLNSATRTGQFFTHDVNLYITRSPLAISNMGFKLEGIGILQYQKESETSGKFGPYSLGGSFGPYFKFEIKPKWVIGADIFFEPQKNYLDPLVDATQKKSGWGQSVRLFTSREERRIYWNPTLSLRGAWNQTSGTEYRSKVVAFGLDNAFFLDRKTLLGLGASIGATLYDQSSSGKRQDIIASLSAKASYSLSADIGFIGQLGYTNDLSNIAAYQYHQWLILMGANYSM